MRMRGVSLFCLTRNGTHRAEHMLLHMQWSSVRAAAVMDPFPVLSLPISSCAVGSVGRLRLDLGLLCSAAIAVLSTVVHAVSNFYGTLVGSLHAMPSRQSVEL